MRQYSTSTGPANHLQDKPNEFWSNLEIKHNIDKDFLALK